MSTNFNIKFLIIIFALSLFSACGNSFEEVDETLKKNEAFLETSTKSSFHEIISDKNNLDRKDRRMFYYNAEEALNLTNSFCSYLDSVIAGDINYSKNDIEFKFDNLKQSFLNTLYDTTGSVLARNIKKLKLSNSINIPQKTRLLQLKIDARIACDDMISFYSFQVGYNCFMFRMIESIVYPKNIDVKLGEYFEADIFIAEIDTIHNPNIFIETKNVSVKYGLGKYEFIPTQRGLFLQNGYLKYYRRFPDERYYCPIKINFTVK